MIIQDELNRGRIYASRMDDLRARLIRRDCRRRLIRDLILGGIVGILAGYGAVVIGGLIAGVRR